MNEGFHESDGRVIAERLVRTIHENRTYLSELDGAIGDGDHGINMDKGFSIAGQGLEGVAGGLSASLSYLGGILVDQIGGSMGPLYGTMFKRMARACREVQIVDGAVLEDMLIRALEGIKNLSDVSLGDKSLVDTLEPAVHAVIKARSEGAPFGELLDQLAEAAETGWRSTKDMVSKIGRSSRLGERSKGYLDPGATSCYLILKSMSESMRVLSS